MILLDFNLWGGEWHQQNSCSGKSESYWNLIRMSLEYCRGRLLEPAGNWSNLAGILLDNRWNLAGALLELSWNLAGKFPTAGPVGFQSLGLGLARGDLQPSKSGMEPLEPLEPWNLGALQPCTPGTLLGSWNPETLEPLEPLEPWNPGTLKPWNPGTLEPWNPGTPEPWNPETLEPWNPATVEPWNRGTLVPWNLGTLETLKFLNPKLYARCARCMQ